MQVKRGFSQKKNEMLIGTWERKVIQTIFGSVNERNMWRIKSDQELRRVCQDLDLGNSNTQVKIKMYEPRTWKQ
jgi:hypothetical protein